MNERLIKLLQLSQSPNDCEALAAIRKANAILAKENMDWRQFFNQSSIAPIVISTGAFNMQFTCRYP